MPRPGARAPRGRRWRSARRRGCRSSRPAGSRPRRATSGAAGWSAASLRGGVSRRELRRQGERGRRRVGAALQEDDRRLRRGEQSGLLRRDPRRSRGPRRHRAPSAPAVSPAVACARAARRRRQAERASQSSWKPPIPLIATIAPRASAAATSASAAARSARSSPAGVVERSCGPHSGQAFGWAWKRRLAGSSYSRAAGRAEREAAHRRRRPVVRQAEHDREARPAVGAVGERIVEPAVAWREELACGTRRRSRGRAGRPRSCRRPSRSAESRSRSLLRLPRRRGRQPLGGDRLQDAPAPASPPRAGRRTTRATARGPSTSTSTPCESLRTQPASSSSRARR